MDTSTGRALRTRPSSSPGCSKHTSTSPIFQIWKAKIDEACECSIAPDLGAILVAVGAVAGMDISTYAISLHFSLRKIVIPMPSGRMKVSIGTQDTRTDGPLSNVLGPGPGLFGNGSHNMLENDGSVAFLDEALAHNGDGNVFDPNAWGAAMQAAKEVGGNFDMAWTGRKAR